MYTYYNYIISTHPSSPQTPSMTPPTSSQIYDLLFFIYSYYIYMRPIESMYCCSVYMCFRSDHLGLGKLMGLLCP